MADISVQEPLLGSGIKPPDDFLERVKKEMQKRFTESKKFVDGKKGNWEELQQIYDNQLRPRGKQHEANLLIPKGYYIVETITPQVLNTLFGMARFLSIKDPLLDSRTIKDQEDHLMWFMLRKMKFYLRMLELIKGCLISGTSINKIYLNNGVPAIDPLELSDFFPDVRCRRPGDIDDMIWCFHRFRKDFSQLERATTPRTRMAKAKVPRLNMLTVPPTPYKDEQGTLLTDEIDVPESYSGPLYFNLDVVWDKYVKGGSGSTIVDSNQSLDILELTLLEMWGEIETSQGTYDVNRSIYTPGRYEEYVCTGVLGNDDSDQIGEVIRCEKSTFKYYDQFEGRDKYLKPFQACLYSITPNQFYGVGAIEPVKSLIQEVKEHHDLYLDEHKRSVMSILSVLRNSGLAREDLVMSPFNLWKVRRHEDVKLVEFPEINLQAFSLIHNMLDREIDRSTGATPLTQGVSVSKRQTYGEIRSLLMETSRRYTSFIQTTDQCTLRPEAFKIMLLMKQMPHVRRGEPFVLPDRMVTINPDQILEHHEISFAATAVEPEYSLYSKQEAFPKLVREIAGAISQIAQAKAAGSDVTLDLDAVLGEMETIYSIKDAKKFVKPSEVVVPVGPLMMSAGQIGGQQLQGVVQDVIKQAYQIMSAPVQPKPR